MIKNILVSISLIFLIGCFDIYFKHPQPRGGKIFNKNLEQIFTSAIPKTINSNDTISILNEIINDTLKFIEIRNKQKVFELELQFFNSVTIIEKFITEDIIDSISQNAFDGTMHSQLTMLKKENIICFNKKFEKDGREVYEIPIIIEKKRSNNDFKFLVAPFIWSLISSSDDSDINHMKKQLNIIEYHNSFFVADPSYMSLRNHLKNTPPLVEFSSIEILVLSLFGILEEREKSKSKKYKSIEGFINYQAMENLIIFSKDRNKFTKKAFEKIGPVLEKIDKK